MIKSTRRLLAASSVALLVLAGGCASNGDTESELQRARAEQDRLRADAAAATRAVAERDNTIASLQRANAAKSTAPPNESGGSSDLFPPNAKAGECYARVIIPATYETETERVLATAASERVSVTPARFGPSTERVLVKEASTRLEVIPATYKTVTERVLVKPASTRLVTIPATYKTESERILVKPAHTEWKRGTGRGVRGSGSLGGASEQYTRFEGKKVVATKVQDTGEVMCLVEVPAEYRTVTRKVLATPASTREEQIPAQYKTITRTVLDRPASTREIAIPAQYKTITTTKLVAPASSRSIEIPATYKTITKRKKISDDVLEWRPVLCEVNMTPNNIAKLQRALSAKGCYPHRVDGVMGQWTINGSKCYAKPRGLPSGDKYITLEVIESLGINLET